MSAGEQYIKSVGSGGLLNHTPVTGDDVERVSSGTRFALREWLSTTAATV